MKIYDLKGDAYQSDGWFLSRDYSNDHTRMRDFAFIRKYYTKVPCSQTETKKD